MKEIKLNATMAVGCFVLGSLAGGFLGYGLARARARREYAARLDTAVAEVKAYYSRPIFKAAKADVVELDPNRPRWAGLIRAALPEKPVRDPLEGLDDGSLDPDSADEGNGGDGEGTELERAGRLPAVAVGTPGLVEGEPDHPFEITEAAFGELNDEGFQTISVTYYEADRTLCDDRDQPIRDVVGTVGTTNPRGLNPELSGDPQIRYVRNRRLEVDFEILLDARSFSETVLGYGQPNKRREKSPASTSAAD